MELKEARSWNIVLPKEYGDEEEKAFCEDLPGNAKCTMMGHPSEGGFGFVALTATEAELEQILRKHPGSKRTFVEPDMPMAAIPDIDVHENGDTLLEFQDQSSRRRSGTTWGIDRIDSGGRGVPTLDATSGSGLQTCSPSSTTCSRDA